MPLAFHPASEIFPLLEGKLLADLMADIRENGLREAVILHPDGRIIDGRNRYRACVAAGIEPRFTKWDGKGSLTALVISLNLHRRHLDASQRAMVAAKALPLFTEEAKERQGSRTDIKANLPECSKGQARDKAAETAGVSGRSVDHASTVLRHGGADLVKAVEAGKTSVSSAAKSVRSVVNRLVSDRMEQMGIATPPSPKRAREIAIATGKPVTASNNRVIPPVTEVESKRRSSEQYAVRCLYEAIDLVANSEFKPRQMATLGDRYACRKLRQHAIGAQQWLTKLIEELDAKAAQKQVS